MPIPVRSQSPVKADSAASGVSSASTIFGGVPQSDARGSKEPTRLLREPASDRATSSTSARRVNDSKPRDPGSATQVGISKAGAGVHSSASKSGNTRVALAVPKGAVGARSAGLQHGTSIRNAANVRVSASTSQDGAMGASTRARGTVETRNSRETGSRLIVPAPSHAILSTASKTSLYSSAEAPALSTPRPVFSTYQQRFSPRKPATIPLPSALAPDQIAIRPGSAGRVTSSTECDENLHDELMQLSLVQEGSAATLHTYEESVKLQFKSNREDLEKQLSLLKSLQRDRQATVNALAVSSWLEKERQTQDAACTGSDALLILAHNLRELQDVSEESGPLEGSLKIFEDWCIHTSSRRSNRNGDELFEGGSGQDQEYVLHLSSTPTPLWSALVSSVEDRTRACAATLADLRRPDECSSIGLLIRMHTILAEHILQEIRLLRAIEGLIVLEEREWVGTAVEAALCDAELHHSRTAAQASTRRGIWAAVEAVRCST